MTGRRDVFQAIADPTRRDILTLIANNPLHLNAIAENFAMSRPAISQHVKILTECGLVDIRQEGRNRFCVIQPEMLIEVVDWLQPFRELWVKRFDQLDKLLETLHDNQNQQDDV